MARYIIKEPDVYLSRNTLQANVSKLQGLAVYLKELTYLLHGAESFLRS
jgi:hypothetical protein